jgi:hypothetical protein
MVDLGKGVACKGRCESYVRELIALIEVNVALRAKIPRQWRANYLMCSFAGWFLTGTGLLLVLLGLLDYPMPGLLFGFGGLLLFFAVVLTLIVARMPRLDARKTDEQPPGVEGAEESA